MTISPALKTRAGEIVTGCNLENASYGLTMCAERVAVFKAVSEGLSDFEAIVVVADSKQLTAPCGPCRQILWEFCGDILVHMSNSKGRTRLMRLRDLLVVEDIVDTGLTLNYLVNLLKARGPRSLKVVALLSKPARRLVEVHVDYVGFTIEDEFVVGYGLDYNERYRNLRDIVVYGG